MNIPGFNAEVSLYQTSGLYQISAGWPSVTGGQSGIPQQTIIPQRIKMRCIECVCEYDKCRCRRVDCEGG